MFCLTERQPVPFNFKLLSMHTPYVRHHQYCSKFYPLVREGDLPSQPLWAPFPSARAPYSHHLLHPRLDCDRMSCHGLGICDIDYQSIPVEYSDDHIQGTLKPFQIPRSHHAIFGVKESQKPSHRKSHSFLRNQLVLHHHRKPVPYLIIHFQVEEGGLDDPSLSSPHICFEVRALVPVLAGDDLLSVSKHFQDLAPMGTGAISLQSCQ